MKETLLKIRPEKTKEELSAIKRGPRLMEQIFASIHSLQKRCKGVAFEIGNFEDKICFFIRTNERHSTLAEGQLYAQYPGIDAEQITEDPLEPAQDESIVQGYLKLDGPEMFPIKRHPQFDDLMNKVTIDPLSGITGTLVRFPHSEMRGHISIRIRPIGDRFRRRGLKFIPLLTGGLPKRWRWYQLLFTRAHLARGWKRLLLIPLDIMMGGFLSVFSGVNLHGILSAPAETISSTGDPDMIDIREAGRAHDAEDPLQGAKDKLNKLLFETEITITVLAKKEHENAAQEKLLEIASSFQQMTLPQSNGFSMVRKPKKFLLSHEELATLWHLPTVLVKTPSIDWVMSRNLEPPRELPIEEGLTTLGTSVFRGKRITFGIKPDDRRRHVYTIGKTGMGKSTLLENMIFSDIHAGKGVAVIDPHGDLADAVLQMIPKERTNDVILFDPTDMEYPVSFNMLECKDPEQRPLIASGLMAVFTKIWPDVWSGRMEHILRNTLLALLESSGNSMLGVLRMYADNTFCKKVVVHLTDPLVRSFWEDEYANWSEKFRIEAVAAIQNKVGQLLTTPIIRNIIGQSTSKLDLRHAMDSGKIIIINLSKGKLGEDNSAFLGAMLVTKFQIDAMSRSDIPEADRRDFYLYVDEFQNFATESFATILSEARKYKLNLTMANQFIGQLTPDKSSTMLRDAVFGNVGTIISFQVGSEDSEEIAKQFGDENMMEDILGLPKYQAYVRLMIDGLTSKPFSIATLPPPDFEQDEGRAEKIRFLSRERYATERKIVEDKIKKWAASAKQAKDVRKTDSKKKEKESEEIKKARKKGMKLDEYRKWRDREMWTNDLNAFKKKLNQGEKLSAEDTAKMKDLEEKLKKVGGPSVKAADPEKR